MKIFKYGLIWITMTSPACNHILEDLDIKSEMAQQIVQNWQFVSMEMNGEEVLYVSDGFNPLTGPGFSTIYVPQYWFSYHTDLTYELRVDRFVNFAYGYDDNFQPHYGYWEILEEQNLIVHNSGLTYEKSFKIIELTDTSFIREYERVVYESGDPLLLNSDTTLWPIGETVITREVFEKRKGPCCND